ncbi:MAG: hypothetical protein IPL03_10540 [Sterolibacteriaceae bacterium]|nr:hypothetical protein [Candidatus Methylophosphatis haderslevensis]
MSKLEQLLTQIARSKMGIVNRSPFGGRHEARSVIHGRPVRSLATNRKPAGGG